mmetsp:Transcript_36070/g.90704  ORF Transcript_36070/g.90704 Transcript_36070/m.90704 type:complete len:229 (+) Transcript_36070:856-1542(+)
MLCIVSSSIGHVLKHILFMQAVALGDAYESLRAKAAFGVDVEGLALATTLIDWQLACHTEGVTQLRLSTPELAKDLGDLPCLDTTVKEAVQLRGASGELHHVLPKLEHLRCADHAHGHQSLRGRHDSLSLLLADAFDHHELSQRHESNCLHTVDAMLQESIEICLVQAGTAMFHWSSQSVQFGGARFIDCCLLVLSDELLLLGFLLSLVGCLHNGLLLACIAVTASSS